jgi:hypothetical protein
MRLRLYVGKIALSNTLARISQLGASRFWHTQRRKGGKERQILLAFLAAWREIGALPDWQRPPSLLWRQGGEIVGAPRRPVNPVPNWFVMNYYDPLTNQLVGICPI